MDNLISDYCRTDAAQRFLLRLTPEYVNGDPEKVNGYIYARKSNSGNRTHASRSGMALTTAKQQ